MAVGGQFPDHGAEFEDVSHTLVRPDEEAFAGQWLSLPQRLLEVIDRCAAEKLEPVEFIRRGGSNIAQTQMREASVVAVAGDMRLMLQRKLQIFEGLGKVAFVNVQPASRADIFRAIGTQLDGALQ